MPPAQNLMFDFPPSGCGHCKKMKPEYDEAAEMLNKGTDVSLLVCSPRPNCFVRALSIWSHPHRWTTPHEQTSVTILPLRLGRPLALVAGPGCSVCPAGDVFVISGACLSLPLFPALLPIRPSAVIQHSQPERQAAHQSTPAW